MPNLFKYVDTCSVCNLYKLCRKYCNELICEECHSELNKFLGDGEYKLKQLRSSKGIYHE